MVNDENSYGGSGKITGVQIAAKTGTAEHGADPKTTPPHVWYVGVRAGRATRRWRWPCWSSPAATATTWRPPAASVAAPIGRAVIGQALRDARDRAHASGGGRAAGPVADEP